MPSKLIQDFSKHVQSLIPGYRVVRKSKSWVMHLLNVFLFFTPDFMTRYTTTVGNTVYVPDRLWENHSMRTLAILAHEARHVYDKQKYSGILFGLGYLLPQVLGLLSLLALLAIWFSNYWLLALVAVVFLAPIPAYFRMLIERQGYLMSLCVARWTFGLDTAERQLDFILKQFEGPAYYFMWPFHTSLEEWFQCELQEKGKHPSEHDPIFILVFDYISSHRITTPL